MARQACLYFAWFIYGLHFFCWNCVAAGLSRHWYFIILIKSIWRRKMARQACLYFAWFIYGLHFFCRNCVAAGLSRHCYVEINSSVQNGTTGVPLHYVESFINYGCYLELRSGGSIPPFLSRHYDVNTQFSLILNKKIN